jgi:hypothetical protein
MLLKRWGANRNFGWTALINNKNFSASWNKKDSTVDLMFRKVSDPNGNGQYNFEISLSLEEITKILTTVSDQALQHSPEVVCQKMSISTRSLLRLLISAGGLPPGPPKA